jgi:hypothetical protein
MTDLPSLRASATLSIYGALAPRDTVLDATVVTAPKEL